MEKSDRLSDSAHYPKLLPVNFQTAVSRKWLDLRGRCQWTTIRKPYQGYRIVMSNRVSDSAHYPKLLPVNL